jgi:signal transduction histidine kinase
MTSGPIRYEGRHAGLVILRDVSERQSREAELRRLNRALKAASTSDSAMMRATKESDYLQEVCRIAGECGYDTMWIGYLREGGSGAIQPVAWAGRAQDAGEGFEAAWALSGGPENPGVQAIRKGRPVVTRAASGGAAPFASTLALPLLTDGRAWGVMLIHAPEADAFSPNEVELLKELARDLAYGVGALRLRESLQQSNEALRRSNEDLAQFAHVTSHDLKEPLRMVTGFLSLLRANCAGRLDDKATEYIEFAADAARRMHRLIDDLLSYSAVGRNGEITRASAAESLDEALKNLTVSVSESQALVSRGDLPEVLANPRELTQLFQNLLGNAIKFRSGRRPEIRADATRSGASWQFRIRDNGIGIDSRFSGRIFQIFNRLHTNEEYPGTGIGLAICKKMVERHGGRIWVESEPGRGSDFFFTLPAVTERMP